VKNGSIILAGKSEGVVIPQMALRGSLKSDSLMSHVGLSRSDNDIADLKVSNITSNVRTRIDRVLKDKDTKIKIENMTIKVGLTGITIMGRKNTIRNSRIEVTNPRAGIYLFGGNNLIENNILIFKGEALNESAAPIKLHAGDGTVIRNNVIIIESKTPRQAISLIESKNVVLSNNRIYGGTVLVKAFDTISTFESRGNSLSAANQSPVVRESDRHADQLIVK
ncbi:MAG: right-handed parallel beta-helix repeat-containing protein, partial [Burkholderiaceae bacterium]